MLCKKRWFDGLNQDFDHLTGFEAKFYCFGGDGGVDSGGGIRVVDKFNLSPSKQNKKAAAQEPKRGRPVPLTKQETLDMVNQAARDSLEAKRGLQEFFAPPQDRPPQNAPSLGDIFGAKVSDNINFQSGRGIGEPQMPTTFEPVSFTTVAPSLPSLPSLASYPDMTAGMSPNVNTYSPPPSANPFTYNLGTGASVTPQVGLNSVGLQFNKRFKNGGVVTSGIGSLFKT